MKLSVAVKAKGKKKKQKSPSHPFMWVVARMWGRICELSLPTLNNVIKKVWTCEDRLAQTLWF